MSFAEHLAHRRRIRALGTLTPLIVPSFSSRGFPDLSVIVERLRYDLQGVCLVSAFDLAHGLVRVAPGDLAELVVVDSGGYETLPTAVAADGHSPVPSGTSWRRSDLRAMLKSIAPTSSLIVVSYDHYGPVAEQAEEARGDFACLPYAASDLLLKPAAAGQSLDVM